MNKSLAQSSQGLAKVPDREHREDVPQVPDSASRSKGGRASEGRRRLVAAPSVLLGVKGMEVFVVIAPARNLYGIVMTVF